MAVVCSGHRQACRSVQGAFGGEVGLGGCSLCVVLLGDGLASSLAAFTPRTSPILAFTVRSSMRPPAPHQRCTLSDTGLIQALTLAYPPF